MYKQWDWSAWCTVSGHAWINCQVLTWGCSRLAPCLWCWTGTRGHLLSASSVDVPPTVSVCGEQKSNSNCFCFVFFLKGTLQKEHPSLNFNKVRKKWNIMQLIILHQINASLFPLCTNSHSYRETCFQSFRECKRIFRLWTFTSQGFLLKKIHLNAPVLTLTSCLPSLSPLGSQPSSFHSPSQGCRRSSVQSTWWWGAAMTQEALIIDNMHCSQLKRFI